MVNDMSSGNGTDGRVNMNARIVRIKGMELEGRNRATNEAEKRRMRTSRQPMYSRGTR